MKIYKWFFAILTLAQIVFAITWYLLFKKMDRVIILSSAVYAVCVLICYVAYEVEKYRKRKKELIDNLP